jgi:hypothetical protein
VTHASCLKPSRLLSAVSPSLQAGTGLLAGMLLVAVQPVAQGVEPSHLANTQNALAEHSGYLRPADACPNELRPLVSRLLEDLPTYAGLVAGRSLDRPSDPDNSFGSILLVSEPDYSPIDLVDPLPETSPDENSKVRQVFFTTLERQYWQGQSVSLQNYHWLFLTQDEAGDWYLALMYSSLGSYPAPENRSPTPPQESSNGIIGRAVTLWLRDCRAGAVFPSALDTPAVPDPNSDSEPLDDSEPIDETLDEEPAPIEFPDSIELNPAK